MSKKLFNLYAGIGGNRKLWAKAVDVVAVEHNAEIAGVYKALFPDDEVVVGDAVAYLEKHWRDADIIWASPSCPTHSKMRYLASKRGSYDAKIPDMSLYALITFLQHFCKDKKWVVENVKPYYTPLIPPTAVIGRHLFWANFPITPMDFKDGLTNNERGMHDKGVFDLRSFKMKHRKDQIIRNCVAPEIGLHVLRCAGVEP